MYFDPSDKTLSADQRRRMLAAILSWTVVVTGFLFWVPFVRCVMEGSAYKWSLGALKGRGLRGDSWMIVFVLACTLFVLYWGTRGGVSDRYHEFLVLLHLFIVLSTVVVAARARPLLLAGVPVGVRWLLTATPAVVAGVFLVMSLVFNFRDAPTRHPVEVVPGWTRTSKIGLLGAILLIGAEYALSRRSAREYFDTSMNVIAFTQWLLIYQALKVNRVRRGRLSGRSFR